MRFPISHSEIISIIGFFYVLNISPERAEKMNRALMFLYHQATCRYEKILFSAADLISPKGF
jgi:hypothetical protein